MRLRIAAALGACLTAVLAASACGGSSSDRVFVSETGGEAGSSGGGPTRGGAAGAAGTESSGGSGGRAAAGGQGGEGGAAPQPTSPVGTGMDWVSGGTLMSSDEYRLVLTTGQGPGTNGEMSSHNYRLYGGLVGVIQ